MATFPKKREALRIAKAAAKRIRRRYKRTGYFLQRRLATLKHKRNWRHELYQDRSRARERLAELKKAGHEGGENYRDLKRRIHLINHHLRQNRSIIESIVEVVQTLRGRRGRRRTALRKAIRRRVTAYKALKAALDHAEENSSYFTTFDGKPIPKWIAAELQRMRNNGWKGYLVSGYRTPEYSEQLCYNMCGNPSCPGMCAGRSSNHCCPPTFTGRPYEGAADVSDYYTFKAVAARIGSKLRNDLPSDPVHFSYSGH